MATPIISSIPYPIGDYGFFYWGFFNASTDALSVYTDSVVANPYKVSVLELNKTTGSLIREYSGLLQESFYGADGTYGYSGQVYNRLVALDYTNNRWYIHSGSTNNIARFNFDSTIYVESDVAFASQSAGVLTINPFDESLWISRGNFDYAEKINKITGASELQIVIASGQTKSEIQFSSANEAFVLVYGSYIVVATVWITTKIYKINLTTGVSTFVYDLPDRVNVGWVLQTFDGINLWLTPTPYGLNDSYVDKFLKFNTTTEILATFVLPYLTGTEDNIEFKHNVTKNILFIIRRIFGISNTIIAYDVINGVILGEHSLYEGGSSGGAVISWVDTTTEISYFGIEEPVAINPVGQRMISWEQPSSVSKSSSDFFLIL